MATVNKAIYPPPPPFYALYTQPPPPPPAAAPSTAVDAAGTAAPPNPPLLSSLPFSIFTPPPPLTDDFLKFGEIQSSGFERPTLPSEVEPLYVLQHNSQPHQYETNEKMEEGEKIDGTMTTSITTGASSVSPYPPLVDHVLSLRLLNRAYLQRYLALLASLVPPPGSSQSPPTAQANPAATIEGHLKELVEIATNYSLLLTQLRPHQANQTIIQVMIKQIERRKKQKEKVNKCIADAKSFLAAHGVEYAEGTTSILPTNHSAIIAAAGAIRPKSPSAHESQTDTRTNHNNTHTPLKQDGPSSSRDPNAQLAAFLDSIPTDA